jgi:hypothetical protein
MDTEADVIMRMEQGMQRMEKTFENKCMEIARKIELDRRKVMDADLGRYKTELDERMHEHEQRLKGLLDTALQKMQQTTEETPHSSTKKKKKKKGEAREQTDSSSGGSSSEEGRVLRSRRVGKPTADMVCDPMLLMANVVVKKETENDELTGWGSDVSETELQRLEQHTTTKGLTSVLDGGTTNNNNNNNNTEGLHETVHKLILMMQEAVEPTHEDLDAMWITLEGLHLEGPTRTDIEDIGDRQAELVRTLIVLHDRVSSEAIRLQVSPNTLYAGGSIVEDLF